MTKLKQRIKDWLSKYYGLTVFFIYLFLYSVLFLLAFILIHFSPNKIIVNEQPWCTVFNTGRRDCIYKYYYNKDFPLQNAWNACYPDTIPGAEYCEGLDINRRAEENKQICKEFGLLK
jgi:hypothetical protein